MIKERGTDAAAGGPLPPVLLAERQGVVFVATHEGIDALRVPRHYWGIDMGVVAIPVHPEEARAAEILPPAGAGAWPRALLRPDLLSPALTRLLAGEHAEMSLHPGRDGLKATLVAADGQRQPFPIAPKDALGLLAAVFHHAPRGVVNPGVPAHSARLLLAVHPAPRPQEYRVRVAGAIAAPPPRALAELGLSPSLLEIVTEALDRPSGLLLVAGGSSSGRSTTLQLMAAALVARGRRGGRIGPRREGTDIAPAWLADSVTDWPFPESLKETAPDFVVMERLEGLRHLLLAARLAGTGTLVLAGAPPAEPLALVRRVTHELESAAGPEVPVMVLAQALVRTVCRACHAWRNLSPSQAVRLGFHRWDLEDIERRGGLPVPFGRGCSECASTGYNGLTGVFSYAGSDDQASVLPKLREDGWHKVAEGVASHDDVASLPGAHRAMRSLREVSVLAGWPPAPRVESGAGLVRETAPVVSPKHPLPVAKPAAPRGSTTTDVETLVHLFRSLAAGKPPQPELLAEIARGLAGRAVQGTIPEILAESRGTFHLGRHSVNTALLAVRIVTALGQGEDGPATAELGLLHDAGLLEAGVDPGAERAGVAGEEDLDPARHCLRSGPTLKALGITDPDMTARVADVHACLSPQPEPGRKNRSDLRVQAVALSSLIDLIHGNAPAGAADLHDVSSIVMARHGQRFSPLLFRALLRAIPIFPVGCWVELSSGDLARVVTQNDDNHFRPRVEITPGTGRLAAGDRRVVDLARAPFLHIRQRVQAHAAEERA